MDIQALRAFEDNYIWLLRAGRRIVVVDPGDEAPVLDYLAKEDAGLAAILLPLLSWGSVPLLFVSMLTLGFFYGSAFVALTSYFFSRVPKDKADSMIAIQGSLFNAAISLGFAVTSLLVGLFTPAFPAVLIPIGIAAVLAGILFAFVPKLLPGLADSLFNHKKK